MKTSSVATPRLASFEGRSCRLQCFAGQRIILASLRMRWVLTALLVSGFLLASCPQTLAQNDRETCTESQEVQCDPAATCLPLGPIDFACTCREGFTGSGLDCQGLTCTRPIIPNSRISQSQQLFERNDRLDYSCDSGYSPVFHSALCEYGDVWSPELVKCTDVDECSENTHTCVAPANCINTVGSFQCDCGVGFKSNGTHCIPTDETCVQPSTKNGRWIITPPPVGMQPSPFGSLATLECLGGFGATDNFELTCDDAGRPEWLQVAAEENQCLDIDECAGSDQTVCPPNSICTNLIGSYNCSCADGHTPNTDGTQLSCLPVQGTDPSPTQQPDPVGQNPGNEPNTGGGTTKLSTTIVIVLVVIAVLVVVVFIVTGVIICVHRVSAARNASREHVCMLLYQPV
eukprot:scpid26298/ scgid0181/ Latent-transforming growth factor beta-binding protein 1; Transforming growth factor beta-1-binding protein 1